MISRAGHSERGLSVVELVVGVAILGLVLAAFAGAAGLTRAFTKRQDTEANLARRGLVAIQRLSDLVRGSEGESFIADPFGTATLPDGSVTEIQVRRVVGVDGDWNAVRSEVTRIRWTPSPGEVYDQIDNDGDGLVDEGDLIAITATGKVTLLAHNVPDQGLRIRDTGDGFVSLSVTLQHPRREGGRAPLTRTFDTRVPLR
jgi:type II secretory pathway pseudopilin PulG